MSIVFAALLTVISLAPAGASPAPRARLTPERIEAMLTAPERRVRALNPTLATLVAEGVRRSYTFARLLQSLDEADLIVYIESQPELPTSLAGRLMIVPGGRPQRYVRVEIAPLGSGDELICVMAHELQHALEVAMAPDVRDEEGLTALYKRIGHRTGGRQEFDTIAAREMGRMVRSELAG